MVDRAISIETLRIELTRQAGGTPKAARISTGRLLVACAPLTGPPKLLAKANRLPILK